MYAFIYDSGKKWFKAYRPWCRAVLVSGEMLTPFLGIISLQFPLFVFVFLMALRIQCVEERMRGLLFNIIRISKQVSLLSLLMPP